MEWIAPHVNHVVGVDISFDYMQRARYEGGHRLVAADAHVVVGDANSLPFTGHQFDLVWCAQSFYDFPDPLRALREMRRVVRPGGRVAVLENDRKHQLLLPWPVTLELALQQAELQASRCASQQPGKFYIGRRLDQLFRQSGLYPCQKRTYATNRHAPFDDATREFLHYYLRFLQRRVEPFLTPEQRCELEACISLEATRSFFNCADLTVTAVDHVMEGIKLPNF
jgi:ubiquinone/menaquinone biosynthesis C-methylase UbiE